MNNAIRRRLGSQGSIRMDDSTHAPDVIDRPTLSNSNPKGYERAQSEESRGEHMLQKVANQNAGGAADVQAASNSAAIQVSATDPGLAANQDDLTSDNQYSRAKSNDVTDYERFQTVAKALADEWRAGGGVPAAMAAIRGGDPEKALHAAKVLADLVVDVDEADLVADGAVRGLLQVLSSDLAMGESDVVSLEYSLFCVILDFPLTAKQLVAAYADNDPMIVFAALHLSIYFFCSDGIATHLLEVGAAPALVTSLSHPSPYVRCAAAFIATADSPTLRSALLSARVVSALLRAALDTRLCAAPCPPSAQLLGRMISNAGHLFSNEGSNIAEFAFSDADWFAASCLLDVIRACPPASVKITTEGGPKTLLNGLRLYDARRAAVFAEILRAVLVHLSAGPQFCTFCKELVAEGLVTIVESLLKVEHPDLAQVLLDVIGHVVDGFFMAGEDGYPPESVEGFIAALERVIKPDAPRAPSDVSVDAICNEKALANIVNLYNSRSFSGSLSATLLAKLAHTLITADWEARFALEMVFNEIVKDGSGQALDAAVSGGFVQAIFRMLKGIRESTLPQGHPPIDASQLAPDEYERKKGSWISECEKVLLASAEPIVSKEADAQHPLGPLLPLLRASIAGFLWRC